MILKIQDGFLKKVTTDLLIIKVHAQVTLNIILFRFLSYKRFKVDQLTNEMQTEKKRKKYSTKKLYLF